MKPAEYLVGRASARAKISVLSSGMTADGVVVYLVEDGATTVLQVSPAAFPKVVREQTEKIDEAHEALPYDLARHIAGPIKQWEINGVSCALFEKFTPISHAKLKQRFQLRKLRAPVLSWLRKIAEVDRGPSVQANHCLQALVECPYDKLQEAAKVALDRVSCNLFTPRARVMHGDMTCGNVMLDPTRAREFIVIDWRGSNVNGFPIFDLVKFAETVDLEPRVLRSELAAHAERLACELTDTRSYLVAALGYIWLNLEQFPAERFARMAERNLETLNAALHG